MLGRSGSIQDTHGFKGFSKRVLHSCVGAQLVLVGRPWVTTLAHPKRGSGHVQIVLPARPIFGVLQYVKVALVAECDADRLDVLKVGLGAWRNRCMKNKKSFRIEWD